MIVSVAAVPGRAPNVEEIFDRTRLAHHDTTTLHPVGVALLVVLALAILTVRRRNAVLPLIAMACLVSPAQRVVLAGLDFHFLRLLVLAGWARLFLRGEHRSFRWGRTDRLVLAWVAISFVSYVALRGSTDAIVNRAGRSYDIFGLYVFFRCVLRTWEDLERVARFAAWLALPALLAFAVERSTGRNLFSFLGGVPEQTLVREGRVRAQGPFPNPILAGCFWVTFLPLLAVQWWRGAKGRRVVVWGVPMMIAIVFLCASSTPLGGVAAVAAGGAFWVLRRQLRVIRWGAVVLLVGLHLVMEAPVWHLISRIDLAGGSTGWHRYLLIDSAIRHFDEWWLFGTKATEHWGPDMWDTANQYVFEGVAGGILGLVAFVAVMASTFASVGRLWRRAARPGSDPARTAGTPSRRRYQSRLAFALGVSLFGMAMMFLAISISYAPQNLMVFLLVVAAARSLEDTTARAARRAMTVPVAENALRAA